MCLLRLTWASMEISGANVKDSALQLLKDRMERDQGKALCVPLPDGSFVRPPSMPLLTWTSVWMKRLSLEDCYL